MAEKSVHARTALFFALLVASVAVCTDSAAARPRRSCYDCHEDARAEYTSRKITHAPVAEEKCETCHKRHGFLQTLILQKAMPELCTDCHQDVGAAPEVGSSHLTQEGVACSSCHDPHASDTPGLLASTPAETCAGCHAPIATALNASKQHAPFAEGRCNECHAPHTAPEPGLLIAPQEELCARCHGAQSELPELHRQPEVAGAPCSSCHDPHAGASSETGSFIHAPYAEASCDVCHADVANDPTAFTLAESELCSACHDVAEAAHLHAPASEGDCLFCHAPHNSKRAGLLRGSDEDVCIACHSDLRDSADLASVHMPFGAMACTTCHASHGSEHAGLLRQSADELCRSCHEAVVQQADSVAVMHPPLQDDCRTCHASHAPMP
jgi:predicted CXXCH cytochrome family protein